MSEDIVERGRVREEVRSSRDPRVREAFFASRIETWKTSEDGSRDPDDDDWRIAKIPRRKTRNAKGEEVETEALDFDFLGPPADYRVVEVQAPMAKNAADLERWKVAEAGRPPEERADPTLVDLTLMAWNDDEDDDGTTRRNAIIAKGHRAFVRLNAAGEIEASIGSETTTAALLTVAKRETEENAETKETRVIWRCYSLEGKTPFARAVVRLASSRPAGEDLVPAIGRSGVMPSSLSRMIGDTPMEDFRRGRRITRKNLSTRSTSALREDAPSEVVVRLDEETRGLLHRKRQGQFVFAFQDGEAKGSEEDLVLLAVDTLQALDTDAHKSMLVFIADAIAREGQACLDPRLLKHVRLGPSKKASAAQSRRFADHARLAQRIGYEVEKADGSDWRRGLFFVASEFKRDGSPSRFDLAGRIQDEITKKRLGVPFPISLVRLDGKRHDWTYRLGCVFVSRAALGSSRLQRAASARKDDGRWVDSCRNLGDLLAQAGVLNARKVVLKEGAPKVVAKVEEALRTLRDGWPDLDEETADPIVVDYRVDWDDHDILASPVSWVVSDAVRTLNLERRGKSLQRSAAAGRKMLPKGST